MKWVSCSMAVSLIAAYGLVSYSIMLGVTESEREPQEDHPSNYGLGYEDVEFLSRKDRITLDGWYTTAKPSKGTIILVHGIGSVRSGNGAVEIASLLNKRGLSALLFDLRAHGSSGGDQISAGQREKYDVMGAFDYLVGRGVAAERIGLLGFSMGAGISILAASEEPEIRAVVADSPFANVADLVAQETARKTIFPEWIVPIFLPTTTFMAAKIHDIHIDDLVPEKHVAQLNYPVMIIHGHQDTRIPVSHGLRVYRASPSGSTVWVAPDVDHVDTFLTYPTRYIDEITGYFEHRFNETME